MFGLAVYQINIIVLRQLASYLPAGLSVIIIMAID